MTTISGLHQFDLPNVIEAVWRAMFFIGAACALGWIWVFLCHWRDMPRSRSLLMAGLSVVIARTVFVNIERWHQALYLEGLPIDTVWLLLALGGLWRWTHEQ
jgi:hypothetical protein